MREVSAGKVTEYRRLDGYENPDKQRVCSYCRFPRIEGQPRIPIVDVYDPAHCAYKAYRWACMPGCAKAHIIQVGATDLERRLVWQRALLVDSGWPHDKPIPVARSWEELDVNGGPLTIDEWRATCGEITSCIKPVKVVPHKVLIEVEREVTAEDYAATLNEDDPATSLNLLSDNALDSLSTEGLARPPDELNVKTEAELLAKHGADMIDPDPGYFAKFVAAGDLPSEEECTKLLAEYKARKRATRKRNAESAEAAKVAAEALAAEVEADYRNGTSAKRPRRKPRG